MTYQPPPPPPGEPPYGGQPPVPGGGPQYGAPPPPPQAPSGPPPGQQWGAPPPPPASYGAPAPGGFGGPPAPQYGAPAPFGGAPKAGFNPASVNPMDWAILGLGFLTFIFSFLSYYTVKVSFEGISESGHENAWHGFFGWFAAFLALVAAGLVAVELFAPQVKLPVPVRLASLGVAAVALLCVLLALVVFPGLNGDVSGAGIHKGRGIGYWIDLIFIIALVVLSVLRLKATGGKLPWEKGPAAPGGFGGPPAPGGFGGPPPAQGGYGPPSGPPPGYGPPAGPPPGGYPPPPPPGSYGPPR